MNFNFRKSILFAALLPCLCIAQPTPFSGTWQIDLRTPEERRRNFECGTATFELLQSGDKVSGNHSMATPRCGRINEGGEGTVKGIATGKTAVLVVTSGRNGAIVLGRARLVSGNLQWEVTEEIKGGEPDGDSPLIFDRGTLLRARN